MTIVLACTPGTAVSDYPNDRYKEFIRRLIICYQLDRPRRLVLPAGAFPECFRPSTRRQVVTAVRRELKLDQLGEPVTPDGVRAAERFLDGVDLDAHMQSLLRVWDLTIGMKYGSGLTGQRYRARLTRQAFAVDVFLAIILGQLKKAPNRR